MSKFAIIGDYESTVLYKAFGWNVFYVNPADEESIIKTFNSVLKNNTFKKIFIIEEIYEILIKKNVDLEKSSVTIIPIPGIKGSKNQARKKYSKLAAIATGIKLE